MLKKKFKRVFLALDTNNIKTAESLIKLLKNDLAGLKIGKELFSNYGPNIIKKFKKYKLPIFLDLKFHDIPTTVFRHPRHFCWQVKARDEFRGCFFRPDRRTEPLAIHRPCPKTAFNHAQKKRPSRNLK